MSETDKNQVVSLEDQMNILEQDINQKNNGYRHLRGELFKLQQDFNKLDKDDQLNKTINSNMFTFQIQSLEKKLKQNQHEYLTHIKNHQREMKTFDQEVGQMQDILVNLEERLQKCQDRIGIFD